MKPLRYAATAALLIAAQSAGGSLYGIGAVRPDLVGPLAAFVALRATPAAAILSAVALGAVRDLATIDPFGTGSVAYALAAIAVLVGRRALDPDRPAGSAILAAGGSGIAAVSLVLGPPLRTLDWIPHPAWIIAGSVAYTIVAGLAILVLLDGWKGWLGLADREVPR